MANSEPKVSRAETTLAFMAAGVVGFSLIDMLASLLLQLINVKPWVVMFQIPLIGLPIGFLLIIGLLLASIRRRSKVNRQHR